MSELILANLKKKLDSLSVYGEMEAETRRNALKEELQYYVLNFIYHHPEYSKWIMYGGSALRIVHGLDRMSIDLDFEVSNNIDNNFLDKLKKEFENHFLNTYKTTNKFFKIKINNRRGVTLKFSTGKLIPGYPSEWIDVKVDLNFFIPPKNITTERRSINQNQFSFIILTYNMSALMASKIAAILLRNPRGLNKSIFKYKGRDVYDLLWYMSNNTVPDFDYLNAKLIEKDKHTFDIKTLFDNLTVDLLNYEKMDDLLKEDLLHLFEKRNQFDNWFSSWREEYLRLLDNYKINKVTGLNRIEVQQDFSTGIFYFLFRYATEEGVEIRIMYALSDHWIKYSEGNLLIKKSTEIEKRINFLNSGRSSRPVPNDRLIQYATLFFQKNEKYFKKVNNVVLGDTIQTKVIRMTADKLNPKEQILLNKSALLSCELDDLLK